MSALRALCKNTPTLPREGEALCKTKNLTSNSTIRRIIVLAICILHLTLSGWGQNAVVHSGTKKNANNTTANEHKEHKEHKKQRGKATYYSKRATGAKTSNGSRLHHDSLTCAHRTHPFGTKLKVTNLKNKKHTIVTVTDRGPYGRGKIVDLTHRAAKEIGMLHDGVATVEIEVYEPVIYPEKPKDIQFKPYEFDLSESIGNETEIDIVHPIWERKKMLDAKTQKE